MPMIPKIKFMFHMMILTILLTGISAPAYAQAEAYEPAQVYLDLRKHVLSLDSKTIGLTAETGPPVWGMVMDISYPKSGVTLVALVNDTISLYFTNGGGVIGVGKYEETRIAAGKMLGVAASYLEKAGPTTEFSLPAPGRVRFYFLTYNGVKVAEAIEMDLKSQRSEMTNLYFYANDLITQIRLIDEKMKAGSAAQSPKK